MRSSPSLPYFEPGSTLDRLSTRLRNLIEQYNGPKTRSARSRIIDQFLDGVRAKVKFYLSYQVSVDCDAEHHSQDPEASIEVLRWVCQGLGVDMESVNPHEALRSFGEISWSLHEGDSRNVSVVWSRLRRRVEDTLIGTKQVQEKQHNILECLTQDVDEEFSEDEGDGDDEQGISTACSDWEEFVELYDERLGKGVKPALWTTAVKANTKLWSRLCRHLCEKLVHAGSFVAVSHDMVYRQRPSYSQPISAKI
ncbi:hypothetical protein NMY22_g13438 [Coprinellus aureogranulatus]|nr:hypothetical protein NMY22_g13438 [Coprinellus aureogranulatus]